MGHSLALTLIRHGLTRFNEEKRYIGSTDLPLSERGRADLLKITKGQEIGKKRLLISSDLTRCKETTELLYPDQSYLCLAPLREIDFGDWEGKTYEELKDDCVYRSWLDDPRLVTPPNGERLEQFRQRTNLAMKQVLDLAKENEVTNVTVITHGGVIRQWLSSFAPEKRAFFEWEVPIGAAFTLIGKCDDVRRGGRFTLLQEEPITAKISGY